MRRAVLFLFVGLILLPQGAAAQSFQLTGRVVDSQGGVVVGASVTITGVSGGGPVTERTTADGTFSFKAVAPGRYSLQVESPGFVTWRREVVAAAGMAPVSATL